MILITGASGFIGSVLAHSFNQKGEDQLLLVDRFACDEKWKNTRHLRFANYIHADELDLSSKELLKLKAIFHLGACSSTTETDVDFLWKNNVQYSQKLFHLAASLKIPFIYASSAATYGDGHLGYKDEDKNSWQLRPLNAYGWSKQMFDNWALKQKKSPPFWVGLKFFNVFGPNEGHKGEMRSLVHKAYGQILENSQVRLFKSHRPDFEDGGQKRDFVYVKDCAKAMLALYQLSQSKNSKKNFKGLLNLGSGQSNSFYDLAKATFEAMDKAVNIQYFDMPENIRHQYQYFTQADMTKFHKLLPKFVFTPMPKAVADYVCEHLTQKEGFWA